MRLEHYLRQQLQGALLLDARVVPAPDDAPGMTYVAGRGRLSRNGPPFLMKRVARLRRRLEAAGLPHVVVSLPACEVWAVVVGHGGKDSTESRWLITSVVRECDLMRPTSRRPDRDGTGDESAASPS